MIESPPEVVSLDIGALWRRVLSVRGEMMWIVIGQTAAASGGIVGVKLLTHWLSPDIYGQLALGLTLTTLIQQSILSPFSGAALRFFSAAREAGELGSFLAALKQILRVAVSVIVVVVVVGIAAVFLRHQRAWVPIILWCAIFALFSGFSQALDGMQNAARQRVVVAWHDGLGVWLRFTLGTLVVIFLGAHASSALAGYAFAAVIVFCSQYFFFHRGLLRFRTDSPDRGKTEKWRRAIVAYGWPFSTWGIFVWMQCSSERWALQIFGDTSQVGQYAILFQLGYAPITVLSGVIMQLLSPLIFQIAGDGSDIRKVGRCRRIAMKLAFGTLAAAILAAGVAHMAADALFAFMVPPSYRTVAHFLPLMVLSSGIFSAGQIFALALLSGANTKPLVLPKIATALIAVGFNVIGAYFGGLRGVVLASLGFSLLYFIWILFLVMDSKEKSAPSSTIELA